MANGMSADEADVREIDEPEQIASEEKEPVIEGEEEEEEDEDDQNGLPPKDTGDFVETDTTA